MRPNHRAATFLLISLIGAGCVLNEPVTTPSPTPSAEPTPTRQPSTPAEATPAATPAPSAMPGLADVPRFAAGSLAATNAPGLRVRSRPGTEQRVITSLGVDAELLVGMGPVFIDGIGWYLVRDADADEPEFGEGWVAAGFEPDPFLIPASFEVNENPYLAGFAHDDSGEYGPVLLSDDADVSVRWVASALDADGCSFAVDLRPGGGDAIPAIRATVGSFPAPGELFRQFFTQHPELTGDLFVIVTSDCSWALTFVRDPEPEPEA